MARPLRIEYPGAFYHVTARGNEQKDIFKSKRDREKFLSYLEAATDRYGVVIHAYCLMGNHYHLMLETPLGNLSQIMKHINGSYTTYYNVKRRRAGHLLQGRYKAILVDADSYATELSRYIHLNPVKAGIVATPEEYQWTSYRCYTGDPSTPRWLKTDFILSYFGISETTARKRYHQFVYNFIHADYPNPLQATVASTILGDPEFVGKIQEEYLNRKSSERDLPALRQLHAKPSLDKLLRVANEVLPDDARQATKLAIYLCHQYSGAKLKEIGAMFNLSESGITQVSKRFSQVVAKDDELKEVLEKIVISLKLSNV